MTAYNPADINSKLVHENAEEALHYGLIDDVTYTRVVEANPVKLYTPNYFIRIGLGVLTVIAGLCSSLLIGLMFDVSSPGVTSAFLFFMAAASYGALEWFVYAKKYYNAGIDNVLQVLVVIFIIAACWMMSLSDSSVLSTGLCFIACVWMCYRFIDAFTAVMAYTFLFLYIYFFYAKFTSGALPGAPFIMMAVSAGVYLLMRYVSQSTKWLNHQYCAQCVMLFAVVSFYISGNYYVISCAVASNLYYITDVLPQPISPSWVFWIFTTCTPVAYLFYGISKKSLLFIRVGILALAAAILTIRYYHTVIPADVALMLAGGILIVISYSLITYLRTPKHGYSFAPSFSGDKSNHNAEAVIIAQAFGNTHTAAQHTTEFRGGSSGGGGATGDF